MKIFIDSRFIFKSGIGRCIRELLKRIIILNNDIEFYIAGDPNEIKKFVSNDELLRKKSHFINYTIPIYSIGEQFYGGILNYKLKKSIDLFIFPNYNVPFYLPENTVVIIHDLIHFKFPEYSSSLKIRFAKIILANSVKKAKKIIADSNSTAKDILSFFPDVRSKISVIYNGISENFSVINKKKVESFKNKNGLGNYILFVGNRKPHKNLENLVKSYCKLIRLFRGLKLVIIGKKFSQNDIVDSIRNKFNLNNYIIEKENITDQELAYYYNGASAFILPSFYEGFGLPPLEAMACGCPVIVSNVSSFPEVCGDAVYYIDPNSVDNITDGVFKVLIDENLRKYLMEKGFSRVKLFNWDVTAKNYLNVFNDLVSR